MLSPGPAAEEGEDCLCPRGAQRSWGGGHRQATMLLAGKCSHGVGTPDSGLRGSEGFPDGVRSQLNPKSDHNSDAHGAGS